LSKKGVYEATKSYLEDLYSATYVGKCAGKETQLPLLHKNKIKNVDLQQYSLEYLQRKIADIFEHNLQPNCRDFLSESDLDAVRKAIQGVDFLADPMDVKIKTAIKRLEPYLVGLENLSKSEVMQELAGREYPWSQPEDYFSVNLHFSNELLLHGYFDIAKALNESLISNWNPLGVFGDPGFGKTIYLRQLTHEIADNALAKEPQEFTNIPIFLKSKILANKLNQHGTKELTTIVEQTNAGDINYSGRGASNRSELIQILVESAVQTERKLDKNNLQSLVRSDKDVRNIVLIIDALDECESSDDRYSIVNFFKNFEDYIGSRPVVIFSCRNSHRGEIAEITDLVGDNLVNEFVMYFTPEELQNVMPTKLANAWGISSDRMSYMASKHYTGFKEVANNPLFVGLFCLLIHNEQLGQVKIGDTSLQLPIDGRYSFNHVEFLKKIIDIGLEVNIKDRVSAFDTQQIRKDFLFVSAISELMSTNNFEEIFLLSNVMFSHNISEQNKKILKENLGIIYANDGINVEFTHKTIKEVSLGLLLIEDTLFRERMKEEWNPSFAKCWSVCQILTLVEAPEIEPQTELNLMMGVLSVMEQYPSSRQFIIESMLVYDALIRELNFENGKLRAEPSPTTTIWQRHLVQVFENAANGESPFSLPQKAFSMNEKTIAAHQQWRVQRIRSSNQRVSPIITNRSKLSMINFNQISEVFGIWGLDQVTLSLCENWREYSDLYGETVLTRAYRGFVENWNQGSKMVTRTRPYGNVRVYRRLLNLRQPEFIEIWATSLTFDEITPMGQNLLRQLKMEAVIHEYSMMLDEGRGRDYGFKFVSDKINTEFTTLLYLGYSEEATKKQFLLMYIYDIYGYACEFLFRFYHPSRPEGFEFDTTWMSGIAVLTQIRAPVWMFKTEIFLEQQDHKGGKNMSRPLAKAIRNVQIRRNPK
jgi:archaellum biogenesis ATPase FlaH